MCEICCKNKLAFLTVGVGPASIMVGNLVAGKRIAQASGRDLGLIDDQEQSRKVSQRFQDCYLVNSLLMSLHDVPGFNNASYLYSSYKVINL